MRLSIRTSLIMLASFMLLIGLVSSCAKVESETATTAPPRAADDVYDDIDKIASQIGDLSIPSLVEPAKRTEAQKFIPSLRKLIGFANELSSSTDAGARAKGPAILSRYRAVLVALDDAPTIKEAEDQSHTGDPLQAVAARTDLLFGRWIKAAPDALPALVEEASTLARDNPTSDQLGRAIYSMTQIGQPTRATTIKLEDALLAMKSKSAKDYGEQIASIRKLRELENKPLTIDGPRFDTPGKGFSSDSLKGKVVLLDFWATWCVPCMRAMPHVQTIYKKYHEQGFEIVGISCDDDTGELTKYLKSTPDTAWPQLLDADKPGWNPIATKLGISGIPAMILIDRKGVVRSVEAERELDELIPKLLAEPQ